MINRKTATLTINRLGQQLLSGLIELQNILWFQPLKYEDSLMLLENRK